MPEMRVEAGHFRSVNPTIDLRRSPGQFRGREAIAVAMLLAILGQGSTHFRLCAVDPALHRSGGTATYLTGLVIIQTVHDNQNDGLAIRGRQLHQNCARVLAIDEVILATRLSGILVPVP